MVDKLPILTRPVAVRGAGVSSKLLTPAGPRVLGDILIDRRQPDNVIIRPHRVIFEDN